MTLFLLLMNMKHQNIGIDRMVLAAGATLQFLIKTDWSLMPARDLILLI
jgi:hypothetical protein